MQELHQHALECYPNECCGFISGPVAEPKLLTGSAREVNEADKFHKLDPETFPRTARTYFKINELPAALLGCAWDDRRRYDRYSHN